MRATEIVKVQLHERWAEDIRWQRRRPPLVEDRRQIGAGLVAARFVLIGTGVKRAKPVVAPMVL